MKRFLTYIICFFLPLIILSYPLDIILSDYLKKSNNFAAGEYPVWNSIINQHIQSNLYIYGSSRAWMHYDTQILSDSLKMKVYNFGIDGYTFDMELLRHQMLMQSGQKPKYIIYSLDMVTLFKRKDLYNKEQFLPYMLYNQRMLQHLTKYEGFSVLDSYIPLSRYTGQFAAVKESVSMMMKNSNPIKRRNGYEGQNKVWSNELENARQNQNQITFPVDSTSLREFKNLVQECTSENIKLVFVYPPEFVGGQSYVANRKEIMNIYEKLSRDYEIPFYDFSNDEISKDKNLFYNTEHLNKNGAEIFTKKLSSLLIKDQIFYK